MIKRKFAKQFINLRENEAWAQSMLTLTFLFLLLSSLAENVLPCNQLERDSLLSFYHQISSPTLNWSSTDCCQWEGIACRSYDGRVTHLWLPRKGLSGAINPFLANLSFLSHLNLSRNHLSGPLPLSLFHSLNHLQILDLSFNRLSGLLQTDSLPISIRTLDLSSNRFNGSMDPPFLHRASNLISFNVSNNSFTGPIPSSICLGSPLLKILDFSMNQFSGHIFHGIGECSNLQVFRAGSNSLTGWLPYDLYSVRTLKEISLPNNHFSGPINNRLVLLSNLTILELHVNEFTGELPPDIGLLSNLEQLQLHTNSLNGTLPPSLMDCSNLTTLLLRNNLFEGEISNLDFSKLQRLQAIDFGNNSFLMPDDNDLSHLSGFQNLQILTLGGCKLKGQIPSWIAKLNKLKVLNLSYNKISGPIPTWIGAMPNLFVLNLTKNFLSGDLPREIGQLPALIADNTSSDLSSLALPFLFDTLQYNRLFNLPRGLKVGNNSLSGNIPEEIGRLKLLHILDLNNNNFNGSIPRQLSGLINLEKLDMSGNHLSGEIPESLTHLHFLSSFSVADNDLQGEIPRGGQFDTFSAASFEGNPKLCGYLLKRSCSVFTQVDTTPEEEEDESFWYNIPFGLGYFVGLFAVTITFLFSNSCSCWY
ncbi:hypothetical protein Pfo_018577 [Paulownia fortunei]|nr:hypothetical protein Pfo_018577 [Paulownia fortunei]